MNASQILRFIDADPALRGNVRGVVARDQIPPKLYEGDSVVVNTLRSDEVGVGHWFALARFNGRREKFDSLVRPTRDFPADIATKRPVQHANSDACGYHVCYFLSLRYRGISLHSIVNDRYFGNLQKNDQFARSVVRFVLANKR